MHKALILANVGSSPRGSATEENSMKIESRIITHTIANQIEWIDVGKSAHGNLAVWKINTRQNKMKPTFQEGVSFLKDIEKFRANLNALAPQQPLIKEGREIIGVYYFVITTGTTQK